MSFDEKSWTAKIKAQLQNWRQQMESAGAKSIYAFLAASTIWPIVETIRTDPSKGWMALGGVLAGIGSNLLAEQIQTWKDKVDATKKIAQETRNNPAFRNEIDLVIEKLDAISLANAALSKPEDQHWFQTVLREELSKLGNLSKFEATLRSIVSSGSIEQSILITGDNNSVTYILNQYGKSSAKQADLRKQIASYLTWLCDRCGKIELRGIKREGQQVVQLALEDVYVPLEAEAFDPLIEAARLPSHQRSQPSREIDLTQVLRLGQRIIITGGPGCGKTTVLIYIAWILGQAIAQDNPAMAQKRLSLKIENLPLPLFIPLSAYATFLRENKGLTDPRQRTLASFISHYLIEKQTSFDLPRDFFQQLLRTGQSVILLLDGLDEVPNEDERAQVRDAIEALVTGRDDMFVVATCRTAAYKDRTALGKGFREVRVKPLNEKQVAALVQQAYYHIYRHDPTLRQTKIEELLSGIQKLEAQRRERLGEKTEPLVTSPLIVRMLLVVHFSERQLPDQRAELYMKAADVMLLPEYAPDESIASQIGRLVGSREMHRDLAQHLAFAMHCKGAIQGREIGENDLRQVLSDNPSFNKKLIEDFISITRMRGTLLEERLGVYRFIHLAFQEYLAARYLAEIERAKAGVDGIADFFEQGPILDSWWREPALLVAGYLSVTSPQTAQMFLRRLASVDDKASQRFENLSPDIQLAATEIAGSACLEWQAAQVELKQALIQRIVILFSDESIMARSRPTLRTAAGDTLARLGDPRPEVMTLTDMQFCLVAQGPFWMGSPKDDEMGYEDEKPFHQNDSINYDYWISRYPITNAQFQFFVDARDGYTNKDWWTKAGLAWRGNRTAPDKYGGVFDLPNHPVVVVRWYEAVAFTRWLTAKLRQEKILPKDWQIRLPTEAEWEKAARGGIQIPSQPVVQSLRNLSFRKTDSIRQLADGISSDQPKRRYPWGDDPDPNRANYDETGIGTTSVVGCFANGASPYGAEELSGNVWEWCSTIWRDNYKQKANDQLEGDRARVLRGGSFFYLQRNVRCAFRYWFGPHVRDLNVGFRVVLSPMNISLKL